jgi:hypothetical protein
MYSIESITVKNLDEDKGIVAGLIDEIGIVEVINQFSFSLVTYFPI